VKFFPHAHCIVRAELPNCFVFLLRVKLLGHAIRNRLLTRLFVLDRLASALPDGFLTLNIFCGVFVDTAMV
jgi:hypothetical protein